MDDCIAGMSVCEVVTGAIDREDMTDAANCAAIWNEGMAREGLREPQELNSGQLVAPCL